MNNERLIRTSALCERLSMGRNTAVAFMASLGVYPIPLGVGRGRGNFWLVSAVDAALQQCAESSKPKPKNSKARIPKAPAVSLLSMSNSEAYNYLTHGGPVQ